MSRILGMYIKRDGRTLDHSTLEEFRLLAQRRVCEGEKPAEVVKSLGMNWTSINRWLKATAGRGKGERSVVSRPATGRPTKLPPRSSVRRFGGTMGATCGSTAWISVCGSARSPPCPSSRSSASGWASHRGGQTLGASGVEPAEVLAACLPARRRGDRALAARDVPGHSRRDQLAAVLTSLNPWP